jgi:alpha-1,2-mannosyltransferase
MTRAAFCFLLLNRSVVPRFLRWVRQNWGLGVLKALRSGSFVTRERMRAYSMLLVIAYAVTAIALLVTADGIVDAAGRPLGTDFANVYAAGKLALAGEPAAAYDWDTHHAMQARVFGRINIPYYGWHYPPMFLLIAAALATLPYLAALAVYQAATLAAYLATVVKIAGRSEAWLPALAFPGVFVNLTHGHNGFITAALMGGALLMLDRRPLLAGALFGALAFKPQLGLLVPLVLAATGRWRVMTAAGATALALAALVWLVLGEEVFTAFWHSLPMTQRVIVEGAPGFHKIQSVYAALRQLGLPVALANAVQGATALGVAAALVRLWRSTAAFELKAAALLIGSGLTTPYVLDYDLVVLAPAIAFLASRGLAHGFASWELSLLAALWVLPLAARPLAEQTAIALTPIVLAMAVIFMFHRANLIPAGITLHRARGLAPLKSALGMLGRGAAAIAKAERALTRRSV